MVWPLLARPGLAVDATPTASIGLAAAVTNRTESSVWTTPYFRAHVHTQLGWARPRVVSCRASRSVLPAGRLPERLPLAPFFSLMDAFFFGVHMAYSVWIRPLLSYDAAFKALRTVSVLVLGDERFRIGGGRAI